MLEHGPTHDFRRMVLLAGAEHAGHRLLVVV